MASETIVNDVRYVFAQNVWQLTSTNVKSRNRAVTANYAELKANGFPLPEQPYEAIHMKWSAPLGVATGGTGPKDRTCAYYPGVQKLYEDPDMLGDLDALAVKKFYSKLDSLDLNLGVTVGEGRKTFKHIAHTASRMAGALKSLKRLDFRGVARNLGLQSDTSHLRGLEKYSRKHGYKRSLNTRNSKRVDRFVASAWLELQYGWKPLLADAYAAGEAFASLTQKVDYDLQVRVRKTKHLAATTGPYEAALVYSGDPTCRGAVGYKADFQVIDPELRDLAALGLTNPLEIVWELVPFSFIADWFMPVGSYIDSLDAMKGIKFIRGSKSERLSVTGSIDLQRYGTVVLDQRFHYTLEEFRRHVLAGPPDATRMLRFSKSAGEIFTTSHTTSAIALLRAIF
jgi:hypothetical protein